MPMVISDQDIKAQLNDLWVLAGTMFAEAAGDWREGGSSVEERIAVGCVCRTRLLKFKEYGAAEGSYTALCLARTAHGGYQYDCWRPKDGNTYAVLMADMERLVAGYPVQDVLLRETMYLAQGIIDNVILDKTGGANFYYAPKSMVPAGTVPVWAKDRRPAAAVGAQLFFNI